MTLKEALSSERMIFGVLIIGGYYGLAFTPTDWAPNAKDCLLVVGPLLGVIINAIWKTDKVDRANADTVATLAAKLPDQSGPLQ